MALKALLLRKRLDAKRKELETLRAKEAEFATRENELTTAIDETETDEQRSAVEELISQFEADKAEHTNAVSALENEVGEIEAELADEEAKQNTDPAPDPVKETEERKEVVPMPTRNKLFARMSMQERDAFFARDDVRDYLSEVRTSIKEKRALTNVGLLIPSVFLDILRENITEYSKLYKHVNVRQIGGEGRMIIMGTVPEAIWTECCANLNDLSLGFSDLETDCFKVGGYFAVCNANAEDADIDLASEVLTALGQAIGLALDKAILYGRNTSTNAKMPLGVVSRLAQTEAPTGYPATARPWVDLHTSNIISIPAATTGVDLIAAIVTASGAAKGKYSRGSKVWIMNETTYTALMAATVSTDAAGRIVSGVADTMPVVGGVIEVLSFIPNNVIIGGYFDLYVLAERGGTRFASSEHVRFLQDQTVFKGTARYDGAPAIAEAFVAIGIGGTTPNATMTFAADSAN